MINSFALSFALKQRLGANRKRSIAITAGETEYFTFITDTKLYDLLTNLHSFCRYILPYICICSHQQVLRRCTFLHFDRDYPSKVLYLFWNWKTTLWMITHKRTSYLMFHEVSLPRKHRLKEAKKEEKPATKVGYKHHTGVWYKFHVYPKLLMM